MKQILSFLILLLFCTCTVNAQSEAGGQYKYSKNDGIFVYYETTDKSLYRHLLPKQFDMPDKMMVQLFIMDFYEINSSAEPYKEFSISLLAKQNGRDVWHCVYMPVTSKASMEAGIKGLGLPKTLGDIEFIRDGSIFTGIIVDNQQRKANISIDTTSYKMSQAEESQIKKLVTIPKVNLMRGKPIQATRVGGQANIIDASKSYPNRIQVYGGKTTMNFDNKRGSNSHPFDLKPSKIIATYYLSNKIPFSLGRKKSFE